MPRTIFQASKNLIDALIAIPGKVSTNIVVICIVTGVGLTLITLRYGFMEFCPWGADHSRIVTLYVNLIMEEIWAMFAVIQVAIEVVVDAIKILEGKKASLHVKKPPKPLSAHEVEMFLQEIPIKCHEYTELKYLVLWPLKQLLSPSVCPLLRFVWPVDWLFSFLDYLLGWLSFDPTPVNGGNNCAQDGTNEWICIALGSGYLIVEILVPLLLFVLVGIHLLAVIAQETRTFLNIGIEQSKKLIHHLRL